MSLIVKTADDGNTPHLALTHEAQGFSANKRPVSLLMKQNVSELTEELVKALEVVGLLDISKAAFARQKREAIEVAVREKFGEEDSWLYVEDYNDAVAIFCNAEGMFSVNYTMQDTTVSVDDLAQPITSVISYVPVEGKMLLSEDAEEKLEEGVYTLVKSCVEAPVTVEHLVKMFETKIAEDLLLQEAIIKAVADAEAVLKAQLVEQEAIVKSLQAQVEAFATQEAARVSEVRKSQLKDAGLSDEETTEMFKAIGELADEAFAAIVKQLAAKAALADQSDLFKETGVAGVGEQDPAQVDGTAAILKAKYLK